MPTFVDGNLNGGGMRFALVVARFNSLVTDRLLAGPRSFRRYLPFGECTERAVVVGDHQ